MINLNVFKLVNSVSSINEEMLLSLFMLESFNAKLILSNCAVKTYFFPL